MSPKDVFLNVNSVALDRLNRYTDLLEKWRRVTNLIADDSFADIWERHILDAIHLQRQKPLATSWLDIGSGAGLPGAVIAILLADVPDAQVHCVEIDRRKASFLREVSAQLAIPMKVHNVLAENIDISHTKNIEVVTARAFSTIERILKLAHPFLSKGAALILPRGRQAHGEVARIDDARYRVSVELNPSPGDGVFVRIELRDSKPT